MSMGVDQLSALSQLAGLGWESHWDISTRMPAPFGAFQTTYSRPYVGLPGSLSMVIIGLSSVAPEVTPEGTARPTVFAWKLVDPAEIRFTTIRLGLLLLTRNERPPNQMLPRLSAANIGSQQTSPLSLEASPGASSDCGSVRCVQVWPPSFEIQAGMLALLQFEPTAMRSRLPRVVAMKVSDSSVESPLALVVKPGLASLAHGLGGGPSRAG